jgi:phage terminase Nu1 subunit (DNA packaging protein)
MEAEAPKVMVSISDIAEREGISRQAVSKTVAGLVSQHDIPVERDGRGRIARLSLAHWDHHRSAYANPAKVLAAKPEGGHRNSVEPKKDSFEEARRLGEWLKVEREQLRQAEARGQLYRADLLADALLMAGREIQSLIAKLPNRADDLAVAVSREGAHGLRVLLREIAFDMSTDIANRLASIASDAPAIDEALAEDDA